MDAHFEDLIKKIRDLKPGWSNIFSGKFRIAEVIDFLDDLVELAELVIKSPGSGKKKHELVRQVFYVFDSQYGIIKAITSAIPLPWFVRPWINKLISWLVDLLISHTVRCLNRHVWRRDGSKDKTGTK